MKKIQKLVFKLFNVQNREKTQVFMNTSEIKFHDTISALFIRQPELIEKISESMKEKGYDPSESVVIGRIKDIGDFVVDGHTRMEAAKKAGLDKVPVTFIEFESLEDALEYTYKRQANRRNLTEWEILQVAKLLPKKETRDGKGRSVEKTSVEMGISASSLTHAKTVANRANDEDLDAIKKGEKSINEIYQKVKSTKPKKQSHDEIKKTETLIELTVEGDKQNVVNQVEHSEKDLSQGEEDNSQDPKLEDRDDKLAIIKQDEVSEEHRNLDSITASNEDIIRLLVKTKEFEAVNVIMSKYHNFVSSDFLSKLMSKTERKAS
jgi:ParB family chromosome partitioning protein